MAPMAGPEYYADWYGNVGVKHWLRIIEASLAKRKNKKEDTFGSVLGSIDLLCLDLRNEGRLYLRPLGFDVSTPPCLLFELWHLDFCCVVRGPP